MFEKVRNSLEVRIGVGQIFWNPPALNGAIRQDLGCRDNLAAFQPLFYDFRLQADPGFRGDIRLTLFGHGGQCRHGVAGDDFGGTSIAIFKNEFVEIGGDFGGLPVHAGDGHVSAVGGEGCAA